MDWLKSLRIFGCSGLVLLALLATPFAASAQEVAKTAPPVGQRPFGRLLATPFRPLALQLRGVKLTPEQREQVRGVLNAHRAEMKALVDKTRAMRQAWQQAGKIDIQERRSLQEQRMALLQAVRTEILNLLTPEQQAQVKARSLKRLRR